jgi:hypothetical protein
MSSYFLKWLFNDSITIETPGIKEMTEVKVIILPNTMELSPPSVTTSCRATHEISSILRNRNVHYSVHKSIDLKKRMHKHWRHCCHKRNYYIFLNRTFCLHVTEVK